MTRVQSPPSVLAALLVVVAAAALPTSVVASHAAPTVVVNSSGDAPDVAVDGTCDTGDVLADGTTPVCTLRAALQEANGSPVDTIAFAVPADDPNVADGVVTIRPASALPDVTEGVLLDATTQAVFAGTPAAGTPVVAIDGSVTTGAAGLTVSAGPTEVVGLAIHSFDGPGTWLRGATDTVLRGNHVGAAPDGRTAPGNGGQGVLVDGGTGNVVRGNLVGGNAAEGIVIEQGPDVLVVGNHVGIGVDGVTALPNGGAGIEVAIPTSADVRVGGIDPADGNTVAFNAGPGVTLRTGGLDDVSVLGNVLHDNGGLGIDLNDNGLTPNDAGDGDGGANGSLNFPVPTAASPDEVAFGLDVPPGDYRIEVFRNPGGADPSGHGEGEEFVGAGTVSHLGGGLAAFTIPGLTGVADGDVLTLTATEDLGAGGHGSTSEFSPAIAADDHLAVVNDTGDGPDAAPGDGACATTGTTVEGDPACTLRAALQEAAASPFVGEVRFAVPDGDPGVVGGVVTIRPTLALPEVVAGLLVDGSTQAGWVDEPVVVLDGSGVVGGDLLHVTGDGITLRSLALAAAGRDALHVDGAVGVLLDRSSVRGSARDGVRVVGTADDVAVVDTTIAGSGGLAIDLGGDGVTANDPGDADPGPNGLRNRPVVTAASAGGGTVTLEVALDEPAGDVLLQVFTSAGGGAGGAAGAGEGEVLVHRATVAHPGGAATHTLTYAGDLDLDTALTATDVLADGHGATSEFSDVVTVTPTVLPDRGVRAVRDSTGNGRDGVPVGGMTGADAVPGHIGGALDLDGVDDRIEVANLDVAGDELTLSAWVDVDAVGSDPAVLAKALGVGAVEWRLLLADTSPSTARAAAEVRTGAGLAAVLDPGSYGTADGWVHLTARYDGSEVVLFVDGTAVASAPHAGQLRPDPTVPAWIGGSPGGSGFDGRVDEVTVSGAARSDAWVAATHATQADPGAALTVGPTQTEAPSGWTTSTAQARSGSTSALAPSGVLRSWLTLDGVAESGVEALAWWRVNTLTGLDLGQGVRAGDAAAVGPVRQDEVGLSGPTGFDLGQVDGARTQLVAPPSGQSPAVDAWQRVVLRIDPAGRLSATAAGADVPTSGTTPAGVTATGSVGLRVGALDPTVRWWVDDLRLRRYVAPEPVTSLGRTELAP